MRNKKAFTIIELIAVLVILAILALIVTPIVMSIINKAKTSANKRSIDAYGRSIELAIASHMLDTGEIPESIDELTIEYSGDEVVCETQELKSDSTVYLAGCTVGGKAVEGYTYGKSSSSDSENTSYAVYQIGDHVSYNDVTYYVIEDSDATNDTVKLLKENPLTKTEIDTLNVDNVSSFSDGTVQYGYYYSLPEYSTSAVKKIVDAWKNISVKSDDSATARLITLDELVDNFGYTLTSAATAYNYSAEYTPAWVYNTNYCYWTMTQKVDSNKLWRVCKDGMLSSDDCYEHGTVRPVIELYKSAEITKVD